MGSKWGWHPEDRPTSYEEDRARGNVYTDHGTDGHTGYLCGICALESDNVCVIYPAHAPDLWQQKQIDWQEDCDGIMSAFDDAVATHFPIHAPQNCQTCPVKPLLPKKPLPPTERL